MAMDTTQSTAQTLAYEAWHPAGRVEALAVRLVRLPSETGTPGEAAFARELVALLKEIPYFQDNPGDIRLVDSLEGTAAQSVVATVRGTGRKALLLTGHYDTVAVENYHDLKELCREPNALRDALIKDLDRTDLTSQEIRAKADLASGDFLPGRGMLDMKSGLAAGIAVLERFAARQDRTGNLVLCCSPDEERDSRGMRALRDALPELMADMDLEPAGAINMDVTSDQGDGSEGRAVFAGTIGKLMPFALVFGKSSHASYPYEGLSAQMIAAEIVRRVEANPDLSDTGEDAVSPPPICLEARDLREVYEVTTPERTWLAFNWLYHSWRPEDLFDRFNGEVRKASETCVARLADNARRFSELSGGSAWPEPGGVRMLTFAELKAEAERQLGDRFQDALLAKQEALKGVDNPLTVSRDLVIWLFDRARLSGPAIVTGFASLHYPATRLDRSHPDDAALEETITTVMAARGEDPSRRLIWRPYFEGISDMSFFGSSEGRSSALVTENTPADWLIDHPNPHAFRCPIVNIGPWGREFHQQLERVHVGYAFEELPRILAEIGDRLLADT